MRRARAWLPLCAYGLLLVGSFYPQSLRPWDTVAYVGDSLESVYMVAWNVHQLFRDPLHLFDANFLYPHRRALAFADHRILPSVLVAPVIWITGNPVLAYNLAVGLACLLAALAARHLARALGADGLGAWTAGALYAFHTYQINEAPRLQIVFHGFLPLVLARLALFWKTGRTRHAWETAGLMLLQGLACNYHLLYGCLLLALVLLASGVVAPRVTLGRLLGLAPAAALAAMLFFPIAWPYIQNAREYGYSRGLPAGIDLEHYFSTTPTNLLYGAIGAEVRLQQQGPHFIGFAAMGLATFAVVAWALGRGRERQDSIVPARLWVPIAAVLAVVLMALSLGRDMVLFGYEIGPGPYRLLYRFVPGFQLVRIPERMSLLVMLFVALLAGRAVSVTRGAGLRALAMVLAIVTPLEHLSPLPRTVRVPVGSEVPDVYRWLAHAEVKALVELPVYGEGLIRKESADMYFSTYHFKPLALGYTAFPPLLTTLLRRFAADFPGDASLQAFERVGVDTVVFHRGRPEGAWQERRIAEAAAARTLRPFGRFRRDHWEGPGVDEVFRWAPVAEMPVAPFPEGRRRRDPSWHYRTKVGDPAPAADGDLGTSWIVARALEGDEFYEVTFDAPVSVSGVVLRLSRSSIFPTRFKVGARLMDRRWIPVAFYDDAHALQLLERALAEPRAPSLGFRLSGQPITGIIVMVDEGGESHFGWSIPEIEIWEKP